MCGILGSVQWVGQPDQGRAGSALRLLLHRGPDHQSLQIFDNRLLSPPCDSSVVLGSCRLAILDVSAAGNQPMASPEGDTFLVYNGEICNFIEIRAELEASGESFRSQSDTEILLYAFRRWGAACLPKLSGMFAFAALDLKHKRLFLARDFFGIKPLYYTVQPDRICFASQVEALLELAACSRRVNPRRLYDYLSGKSVDDGEETLFAEIRQLPSAHYLEIPLERPPARIEPTCYWRINLEARTSCSFNDAADRVRELFLTSVSQHLRSDVPVAAALSGGLDSSSIVAAMRHLQGPPVPVHTFTYSNGEAHENMNEEVWAKIAGQAANATMHTVRYAPERLPAEFETFLGFQDWPFGSPVVFAQSQVFEEAHKAGFKVMLSGQGPDEFFAGYFGNIPYRAASLLRQGDLQSAAHLLRQAGRLPSATLRGFVTQTLSIALPLAGRLFRAIRGRSGSVPEGISSAWFAGRDTPNPVTTHNTGPGLLRAMLYDAMVNAPLPAMLRFEDRNSMAFSVENRLPFLTPTLVEFAFSLPEEYLITGDATTKAVFRKAMRGLTPDAILDRRDKFAFPVPLGSWLMQLRPWVDRWIAEAATIPALDGAHLKVVWDRFDGSGGEFSSTAFLLWRWLFLGGWAQRFGVAFD